MTTKEKVYTVLNELNIPYEVIEHKAVFTIEEMDDLNIYHLGSVVKNLFLKDARGKRHFLVVMSKDKRVDLKKLRESIGSSALSFASEERLRKHLDLAKGSVTPLGIINNTDGNVEVIFDEDLVDDEKLGVHPNENTATVWISYKHLETIIKQNGNSIISVNI